MIDPLRIIEIKGQVYQVYTAASGFNIANNQSVITGVSAKRIRIMAWYGQSQTGTAGTTAFKSASGGTFLTPTWFHPISTTGFMNSFPWTDAGHFETNTGEGLFVDVATAAVSVMMEYITYTPS